MTLTRSGFPDIFFSTSLPLLNTVVMNKFNQKIDIIPEIFNMETSGREIEQFTQLSGFGSAPQKSENADATSDDIYQGYDKTLTHLTYSLLYRISKEMVDDDRYGLMQKCSKALGRSVYNTRQITSAAIFNNGFTAGAYAGPDGQALFSSAHPSYAGGSSQSNILSSASDLDDTSLQQALIDFEGTTDARDQLIDIKASKLLVPLALQFQANRLLESPLRPGTANNDKNSITMKGLEYIVWPYLTDPDAWFLLSETDDHSLVFIEREPVNVSDDYDFKADAVLQKIRNRYSVGFYDWPGVFATPGG